MAGKTLDLNQLIVPDQIGTYIAKQWMEWKNCRQVKEEAWAEVRKYVYQTDTTQTTNAKLPWKNKTTTPKLCHIRDNLSANYKATMFPKSNWLIWEGNNQDSENKAKREAIENYISWAIDRPQFKEEITKLVLDYIDYGNCFATVEWLDERQDQSSKIQVGYVGPIIRRISPFDVVMNPIAPSVDEAPKIIQSRTTIGELKELLTSMTRNEDQDELLKLFDYMREIRTRASVHGGDFNKVDDFYQMDGFTSFREYLGSNYIDVLTYYGDLYDFESDTLYRNHKIMVVDRHKVIYKKPNPSFFGRPPIYHAGWRIRQDNLWAMGPLDNLVGMQYRIDHLENLKADLMDLTTFPPIMVKGYVEDFDWGPGVKIFTGDDGLVEIKSPDVQALQVNLEISSIEQKMEEMAGAPKEAMGIRSPGEKTMYEVQRLENASGRMFQNKIAQFEETLTERLLNAMLELARRKMNSTMIRIFDDELKFAAFQTLTSEDITGSGRIRPVAARHFAERAQLIQNLNAFYNSPAAQRTAQHFSSIKEAQMWEELLDIEDYGLVQENVRITEAADAQKLQNVHQESTAMQAMTPAGLAQDDTHEPLGAPQGLPGLQGPRGK